MLATETLADGRLLISFTVSRLDATNAPEFREAIISLTEGGNVRILVDMTNLSYIDSSGLGALVGLIKRIGVKGDLALCGLGPAVEKVFMITRMNNVFSIHKTRQEALRSS